MRNDATNYKYGKLYQWGRKCGQGYDSSDGDYPGKSGGSQSNALWGATKTDYDPCPSGWRVPTFDELNAMICNQGSTNIGEDGWDDIKGGYWFNGTTSPSTGNGLFLLAAGDRCYNTGDAENRGVIGFYWSSSPDTGNANFAMSLGFYSSGALMNGGCRAYGYPVRCVQE